MKQLFALLLGGKWNFPGTVAANPTLEEIIIDELYNEPAEDIYNETTEDFYDEPNEDLYDEPSGDIYNEPSEQLYEDPVEEVYNDAVDVDETGFEAVEELEEMDKEHSLTFNEDIGDQVNVYYSNLVLLKHGWTEK